MACLVLRKRLVPLGPPRGPAGGDAERKLFIGGVGYVEGVVERPSVEALGRERLVVAQWLAVRRCGALLGRRAVDDEHR